MPDNLPEYPVLHKLCEGQDKTHCRENNIQEHVEDWETIH